MKNKIDYQEVFSAVEKAVELNAPMLLCSECGVGFYKVSFVGEEEPDYIFDGETKFCCKDHVIYDLLINPEISQPILISTTVKKGKKIQVHARKVDARIFIPDRNN